MTAPTCPFDGHELLQRLDMDGYTMMVCPECDCRFRADAWALLPPRVVVKTFEVTTEELEPYERRREEAKR